MAQLELVQHEPGRVQGGLQRAVGNGDGDGDGDGDLVRARPGRLARRLGPQPTWKADSLWWRTEG